MQSNYSPYSSVELEKQRIADHEEAHCVVSDISNLIQELQEHTNSDNNYQPYQEGHSDGHSGYTHHIEEAFADLYAIAKTDSSVRGEVLDSLIKERTEGINIDGIHATGSSLLYLSDKISAGEIEFPKDGAKSLELQQFTQNLMSEMVDANVLPTEGYYNHAFEQAKQILLNGGTTAEANQLIVQTLTHIDKQTNIDPSLQLAETDDDYVGLYSGTRAREEAHDINPETINNLLEQLRDSGDEKIQAHADHLTEIYADLYIAAKSHSADREEIIDLLIENRTQSNNVDGIHATGASLNHLKDLISNNAIDFPKDNASSSQLKEFTANLMNEMIADNVLPTEKYFVAAYEKGQEAYKNNNSLPQANKIIVEQLTHIDSDTNHPNIENTQSVVEQESSSLPGDFFETVQEIEINTSESPINRLSVLNKILNKNEEINYNLESNNENVRMEL